MFRKLVRPQFTFCCYILETADSAALPPMIAFFLNRNLKCMKCRVVPNWRTPGPKCVCESWEESREEPRGQPRLPSLALSLNPWIDVLS